VKGDEESYVFFCKIKFLGKHDELKVNMSVNVDIVTQRNNKALLVPREALASKDDTPTVFVVRKNRVYQTKIEIGIRSYSSVEAISGVKAGDLVAVSGLSNLKDNGRIKVEQ
jgi:multidrug efflux pump subunit AcrA (membrane-fusion protein)